MIRPAVLADREQILAILDPWLDRYPLKRDQQKLFQGLTQAIGDRKHFVYVAEENGGVHGVLIGLTGDNLWAQRRNCHIVAWISNVPGEGAKLLRAFRDWFRGRRGIKVAGMTPDLEGLDDRAWDLATRIGFQRHGGAHLLYN